MDLKDLRPTHVIIDVDALIHNIKFVRKCAGDDTLVTAVVKADAYGHGAVEAAKIFLENGADRLAVASLNEAVELRNAGIKAPLLILGYTPNSAFETLVRNDIIGTIYSLESAMALSEAGRKLGENAMCHIKIDSGMSRIGLQASEETIEAIKEIAKLPNLEIEGIFTHMARADEKDKSSAKDQLEKFKWTCDRLAEEGIDIKIRHISNSAGINDLMPDFKMDMVRAGIILYGLRPSDDVDLDHLDVKPAMTFRTELAHVKVLPKGRGISYGHKYVTDHDERIGTIPVGYADGYTRMLSSKAKVGINGKVAKQVGNICMDQCMISLDGVDAEVGDEVILFGNGEGGFPTADDLAKILGTINYEIVCMINRRVPRVYVKAGQVVKIVDYLE